MKWRTTRAAAGLSILLAWASPSLVRAADGLDVRADAGRGGGAQVTPTPTPPPPIAPTPSDVLFVTDTGPMLDTACLYRSGGPIVFEIEVKRFAGELNADGTLRHAKALAQIGLLSKEATIAIAALDVDDANVTVVPPDVPEVDRVRVNGEEVGFLRGVDEQWSVTTVRVPIEKVRFAQRGAPGADPQAGRNRVEIDIDAGNAGSGNQLWCTAVAWATLSFRALSPVLLIHGNNSDGDFFDRQGFTRELQRRHVVYVGPQSSGVEIDMPTQSIGANRELLNALVPGIVKGLGVDSIHLVAHSKGGLDARAYAALYLSDRAQKRPFEVLSFTTLSTPHNGSAGADLLVERENALRNQAKVKFPDLGFIDRFIAERAGIDPGTPDLTQRSTATFNRSNVGRLPKKTAYHTTGGDADLDGDGDIKDIAEFRHLLDELEEGNDLKTKPQFIQAQVIDRVYKILRTTASVEVEIETPLLGSPVAKIRRVEPPSPLGNDTLVTIPSSQGVGSFDRRSGGEHLSYLGREGRNHASIGNQGVGGDVLEWIVRAEKKNGDLR